MTEQLTAEAEPEQLEAAPPGPVRVAWAPVPKVNLLPIEIIESRRFRRTQALLGAAVLLTVLVAAGAVAWAQQGINDAKDNLLASQARVTTLQAQEGKYASVPQVINQVQAAATARTLAMSNDVLWYRYLNEVDDARPSGVQLTSFSMSMNPAGVAALSGNPLVPSGIGAVVVGGTASQYSQVSSWLEALDKINGFSKPTLSSATSATGTVTFTSGAVVDSDALSGRYDKKAG